MRYFVYILYSRKCDKYYVGHSESLERRIIEHNIGKGAFFQARAYRGHSFYSESFHSRSEAIKREREIKNKKSRKYIEYLIQTANG